MSRQTHSRVGSGLNGSNPDLSRNTSRTKLLPARSFGQWLFPFLDSEALKQAAETPIVAENFSQRPSIFYHFRATFWKVFGADGYDPVNRKYDGIRIKSHKRSEDVVCYLFKTPLAYLITFFGIPNHIVPSQHAEGLSKRVLIRNFIGSHDENSNTFFLWPLLKNAWNAIWNTIGIFRKTAWNLVKVFTEFLPRCLEELSFACYAKCRRAQDESEGLLKILPAIGMGFSLLLHYVFKTWRVLGASITSPYRSARLAWRTGNEIGGTKGNIVGGLLAGLSLTITLACYIVIFPLGIKAVMTHAPTVITSVSHWVANSRTTVAVGRFFKKAVEPFAKAFKWVVEKVGVSTSATCEQQHAGRFLAGAMTTIGFALDRLFTWCRNKLRRAENEIASNVIELSNKNHGSAISSTTATVAKNLDGSLNDVSVAEALSGNCQKNLIWQDEAKEPNFEEPTPPPTSNATTTTHSLSVR